MKKITPMKKRLTLAAPLLIAICAGPVWAQSPKPILAVTAPQKAKSDAHMKTALAQLQAAAMAMEGNKSAAAISDLKNAVQDLKASLPIYQGQREKAITNTDLAIKALQGKASGYVGQAEKDDDGAISDVTAGLLGNN
jgi:hypothetical protein